MDAPELLGLGYKLSPCSTVKLNHNIGHPTSVGAGDHCRHDFGRSTIFANMILRAPWSLFLAETSPSVCCGYHVNGAFDDPWQKL